MFPGVDGFRWDAGHIIFLGAFFSVAIIIAATLIAALVRSLRDRAPHREQAIRWHRDFSELPEADRRCRHELTGEVHSRQCPNQLDCRSCQDHPKFLRAQHSVGPMAEVELHSVVRGIPVPLDRFYHRGHTWAKAESDGGYTIGLDELGSRLMGVPDALDLPRPGAPVFVNGTAWTIWKDGDSYRVLSPVSGEVVEAEAGEQGWFLKVRPEKIFRTDHLLKGAEVTAWMTKEVDRLEIALGARSQPALADGGALVTDLPREYSGFDWSSVRARMFLNG
jgi:glycine cleavage system H lipoate-binding protein